MSQLSYLRHNIKIALDASKLFRKPFSIPPSFDVISRDFSEKLPKTRTASSTYRTMNVFDRNAKILQKERAAQRPDYHFYEYIREEVGWRMADRVFDIKRTFQNGVELGCSRGYVSRHLNDKNVVHMTLVDSSQTLLDKAMIGDNIKFTKICMDEENFVLPENSIDIVISSLCLHWVNDLPGLFDRIMKALKPDGVFLACLFGEDTLYELRQSLQLSETERLGGMLTHISPFTRIRDIGGLLTSSGFTMQTVDTEEMVIWYPSMWHVMHDVKCFGESNATLNRPLRLSKEVQFAAAAIYDEMYGKDMTEKNSRGVPATYQLINFLGWKPDPSQPQPLARGSGEMSLKDLHKIDEIAQKTGKIQLTEDDVK